MLERSEQLDRRENDSFVELLTRHQRQIGSYLFSLVHDVHDVDDLLQQTSIILWRKFEEFQPGSDFVRWACNIAHFEAMNFVRSRRRQRLYFNEEVMAKLAETRAEEAAAQEPRMRALSSCLEKLNPSDRETIRECYDDRQKIKEAAGRLNRSADSVYQSLRRIRSALYDCIQRHVTREEAQ